MEIRGSGKSVQDGYLILYERHGGAEEAHRRHQSVHAEGENLGEHKFHSFVYAPNRNQQRSYIQSLNYTFLDTIEYESGVNPIPKE